MSEILKLAILLRGLQFYAHNAHNLASRASFYADHEELGALYGAYEAAYDSLIERMLGLGETPDLCDVQAQAVAYLQGMNNEAAQNIDYFAALLEGEKQLCEVAEVAIKFPSISQGTINLLTQLADDSEARQYKIGRRVLAQP